MLFEFCVLSRMIDFHLFLIHILISSLKCLFVSNVEFTLRSQIKSHNQRHGQDFLENRRAGWNCFSTIVGKTMSLFADVFKFYRHGIREIFDARDSTRPEISHRIFERNEYVFSCFITRAALSSFSCFVQNHVARLITRTSFFNPAVPPGSVRPKTNFILLTILSFTKGQLCNSLILFYIT